jgi:hypothetical protein
VHLEALVVGECHGRAGEDNGAEVKGSHGDYSARLSTDTGLYCWSRRFLHIYVCARGVFFFRPSAEEVPCCPADPCPTIFGA